MGRSFLPLGYINSSLYHLRIAAVLPPIPRRATAIPPLCFLPVSISAISREIPPLCFLPVSISAISREIPPLCFLPVSTSAISCEMTTLSSSRQVHAGQRLRLEGKVALITGAAQGIGASMAEMFIQNGAKVVCVDINTELGQSVCNKLGSENASFIYCDVTSESDVENAVNAAISKHGKLDIMINNAAIADDANPSITDNPLAGFERVMQVNIAGVFLGIKHAARVMIPAKSGAIINLGSISGRVGGLISHAYCSSKHAVVGLTRNAAAELGRHGIRVNCLSSHVVLTPLTEKFFGMDENGHSKVYTNLEGMVLLPEDLAEAAVYLGSDESRCMSGHDLVLDGGFTATNPAFGLFSRI